MNMRQYIAGIMLMSKLADADYVAEKEKRPCLVCGKPHSHNNCFCSADCCREYKQRKKPN